MLYSRSWARGGENGPLRSEKIRTFWGGVPDDLSDESLMSL